MPHGSTELALRPDSFVDVEALIHATPQEVVAIPGLGRELLEGIDLGHAPAFETWLLGERRRLLGAAEAALREAALDRLAAGEAAGVVRHDNLLADGLPSFGAVLLFLLGWQVITAAMMLPSSLPLVRMFAVASARAPGRGGALGAFLGAYALIWSVFGALALIADAGLHAFVNSNRWVEAREWAIGPLVLMLAGGFQFTALKDACLRTCRRPASFLHHHYQRGTAGAFRLGGRHGMFCVGCCWALMLVMFAVGAASLIWMALLTALTVHEKTRPMGAATVPLTGVVLLALGSTLFVWGASTSL